MEYKYAIRVMQIFNIVQFDCFHSDQAWKIIQEYEPDISFDALIKSLERARWSKMITEILWRDKSSIQDYDKLSSRQARKKIWAFETKNISEILDIKGAKIKEKNYPLYAKILLDKNTEIKRRFFQDK